MSTRTPRDYHGQNPLICWPLYWQVMAAKRTETKPPDLSPPVWFLAAFAAITLTILLWALS